MAVGMLILTGLLAPASFNQNASAISVWKSTTDADFNGTGSSFTNCIINGTGGNAQLLLSVVDDWWNVKPSSMPSPDRDFSCIAPIGTDDKVVLFGGDIGNPLDDTWVYDLSDNKWTQMFPEKLHAVALIRIAPQAQPEKMKVVGHQAVSGTPETFARGRVKHHFPKPGVKKSVEPSGGAQGQGQSPVDGGIALVIFARQSGEIKAPVRSPARKGTALLIRWLSLHEDEPNEAHAGSERFRAASDGRNDGAD